MANLEDINGGVTVAPEATSRLYGVKDPTGTPVDIQFTAAQLAALLLASAALTGTPTAPTAAPGTNTTQVATTAFVKAAVDALIAAAPGALDTLDELAAALGDDANFAATLTTALAGKQPLDSDLTAIAALTTTSYGRALLEMADAAAVRASLACGYVLAGSGVGVSHTGDTAETTLVTVTIPAGVLGANGQVVVETLWSMTNNANNKTARVKFGGTSVFSSALTTVSSLTAINRIANRNSATAQVSGPAGTSTSVGGSGVAVTTLTVDTTAAVDILFTGQCANSADTITLESYLVRLFPAA